VLPTMQCDVMQCRDTIMQTEVLYVASNSDSSEHSAVRHSFIA